MSKKLLFSLFAAVGMLAATSCQEEAIFTEQAGDEITATFTMEAPQAINTRAIGDGMQVNKVACAVYDQNNDEMPNLRQYVDMAGGKAQYSVRLAKGQAYRIAFFAYSEAAAAYNVADLKKIEILGGQKSNVENRDAFTAYVDIAPTNAAINQTVTLYRPFAQLNLGATYADSLAAANAGIVVDKTWVRVSNVYTAFSAFDDAVVGTTSTVEFALNTVPTEALTVDGVKYDYLALNYILVGDKNAEKSVTDVEFVWENADGSKTNVPITKFTNVPVQRNYRTNIIGSLLTTPAEFNIIIDAEFENPDWNIFAPWDGTTVTSVAEVNGVYTIKTGAELAWVAKEANNGNNFKGKTIELAADIYLADAAWTPIGNKKAIANMFDGTFDGKGFTIYDLNVQNKEAAGLFGAITGVVKNVNVKNATIVSNHWAGVICGYSTANVGMHIDSCTVDNATVTLAAEQVGVDKWDNGDKAGGIIGYMVTGDQVTNCTVSNTTVTAYRDLGGIVGYAAGTVKNNTLGANVKVVVDATHNYQNYAASEEYDANAIIGHNASATVEGNTGDAEVYRPKSVATVATAAELAAKLNEFGAAGAGNNVINITNDIVLAAGENWTPVYINGYTGAGVITIAGNGKSISGLNAPLLAGGFAGKSGIIIKDLTLKDCDMVARDNGGLGSGAFIEEFQAMEQVTLINCHVIGGSITSTHGARVGGLIGYTAGWSGNGPVDTYVTLENCTVEDFDITADGSVGGLIGHAGADEATFTTITNCKVINCKLNSTDDGGWRVGAAIGTVNVGKLCELNNVTSTGNTLTQTGKTAPTGEKRDLYGRYSAGANSVFTIDGVEIAK